MFEHHVFEEVTDAGNLERLVARSGLDEVPDRDAFGVVVAFTDYGQAVLKCGVLKFHVSLQSWMKRETLKVKRRFKAEPYGSRPDVPPSTFDVSRPCSISSSFGPRVMIAGARNGYSASQRLTLSNVTR
jgi:hypothetical protein